MLTILITTTTTTTTTTTITDNTMYDNIIYLLQKWAMWLHHPQLR